MKALGQGLGTEGGQDTSLPSYHVLSSGEDKMGSSEVYCKREISSLDTERGFMAQTAPEPDQGDKRLGAGMRGGVGQGIPGLGRA